MSESFTEVWNCGGGRQSAAILALIVKGVIQKPDAAAIADTGRENSSTWKYMEEVLQPAAKSIGIEIVRIPKEKYATVDLWGGADDQTLLIPAFTTENGKVGKLPNYCSNEWKTRVIERFLRGLGVKNIRKWLGFSVDEPKRWIPKQNNHRIYMPLVGQQVTKKGCFDLVSEMGWPAPVHSSCWMCPNKSDVEWLDLKQNHPQDFALAVQFQKEIQLRDGHAWLHSSCKPLEEIEFKPTNNGLPCDSGNCFT